MRVRAQIESERVGKIEATDVSDRVAALALQQLSYLGAKKQVVYKQTAHVCCPLVADHKVTTVRRFDD